MAEDYERANARKWDLFFKEKAPVADVADEWQVEEPSSRGIQTVLPPKPTPPNTAPGKFKVKLPSNKPQKKISPIKHASKASPPEWLNAAGKKRVQRKPPPSNLILENDNEGQRAWRDKDAPKANIRIHRDLVLGRYEATQNENFDTIARDHGAFIPLNHFQHTKNGQLEFQIWGEEEAVAAARRAILAWMKDVMPSEASRSAGTFGKVLSLTPVLRERAEKKWRRDVLKQTFRQNPPPQTRFPAIAYFHWPVNEYRPEDVLGKSYEALDLIRMDCKCYVVFDKNRSAFTVLGGESAVKDGVDRIRKTFFQLVARQLSPIRLYLLHWPDAVGMPSHVVLKENYLPTAAISGATDAELKPGSSPRGEGSVGHDSQLEKQTSDSEAQTYSALLRTLRKLHYYRGKIHFRVRLGTFLATLFMRTENGRYKLDEYENMIKMSQFEGEVTQELGDKTMEQSALSALQGSKNLLMPQDAMTRSLAEVEPIYTVVFTFLDKEMGDLRLSMSWQKTDGAGNQPSNYQRISKKWSRLERDFDTETAILDASLTDLNIGLAWHFEMHGAYTVEESRLKKPLVEFGHHVKIDPIAAQQQSVDKLFVTYKMCALHMKSIQQRINYRYAIIDSEHTLELARVQNKVFPAHQPGHFASPVPTVYEPRWCLSVYCVDWDTMLAENERLPIGARADWKDDAKKWFPLFDPYGESEDKADAGFAQLMARLKTIANVVRAGDVEDLIGGMTIG